MDVPTSSPSSPWLTTEQAARYLGPHRSRQFVRREIRAGRLRAARIGGRKEFLTRAEWLDEYVADHAEPLPFQARRRRRA